MSPYNQSCEIIVLQMADGTSNALLTSAFWFWISESKENYWKLIDFGKLNDCLLGGFWRFGQ